MSKFLRRKMLRRTPFAFVMYTRYNQHETTYPYPEPFKNTPYEKKHYVPAARHWPRWMDEGVDGTGRGIGLYRTHSMSKLKGNLSRKVDHIPYVIRLMIQGVYHASGEKYVRKHGRVPDPFRFPVLTGKPSSLVKWVHEEPELLRTFEVPVPDELRKDVYKPYVALHEMGAAASNDAAKPLEIGAGGNTAVVKKSGAAAPAESKPLKKRLFFWK